MADALKQAVSRPFVMASGPMIHASLIPIQAKGEAAGQEEENMLVLTLHYSVADGWSMGVLFRDLSRAYNMLKLGEGKLPVLCQQEQPFALWWGVTQGPKPKLGEGVLFVTC